jgi:O-antigen ligase
MTSLTPTERPHGLERTAWLALLAFIAAIQVQISVAQIFLALAAVLWLVVVVRNGERVEVPKTFWPLAVYAAWTIVAAIVAVDRDVSLRDTKQLVLFAIVPIAYRLLPGRRSLTAVDVLITVGALEAIVGIVQYAILNYNNLGQRVQGFLTHYMTYSGVMMLVACTAAARIMFRREDRTWAALVMPALLVALTLTMSRNAISAWWRCCLWRWRCSSRSRPRI